jgi:hypothetical protein
LYNGTVPSNIENNNAPYRALGLFGWEDIQGSCSYEKYDGSPENDITGNNNNEDDVKSDLGLYWDLLGSDFEGIRITGGVVLTLGFLVLMWMICVQSCVAHTRQCRAILGFLLVFLLPLLQSLTFRVVLTEFCEEKNCEMYKTSYTIIIAMLFYFLAGLLLCIGTQDFPGNPYRKRRSSIRSRLRTFVGGTSQTSSSNDTDEHVNNSYNNAGSSLSDVEMTPQYHNGFADAVEIPVESEFIDRTLIDADAAPVIPSTMTAHTTIHLSELVNSTTTAPVMMSDNHSIVTTSPYDLKSNL